MRPIDSTEVFIVEPGTEIENPDTGEKTAVDDSCGIFLSGHGKIWLTPKTFAGLMAHPRVNTPDREP